MYESPSLSMCADCLHVSLLVDFSFFADDGAGVFMVIAKGGDC
jgi:hypothetical protein